MMDTVTRAIKEHIADRNIRFVFPSQISANRWARKTCALGIVRSVAANRFLAWDHFKEEAIREKDAKRGPASALIRKLFAESLIRKNSETTFLKSIIPVEYAQSGKTFAPFIARLLPSLSFWAKLRNIKSDLHRDDEDGDYEAIKKEYAAFLERHKLFEPSWEETKIGGGESRYVIFFPELIEDFDEYDTLLKAPRFIRVTAETAWPSTLGGQYLTLYKSAREEIRSAVMELRELHEEGGIPYEDMAVSVPELEEMEPWLLREFSLRQIPVVRRAGKKLGETGAGRLFALVNECAASRFSFNSLKALILNDHIPWKEREKNKALVDFGIKFNCVSGYAQNGKSIDIWEEAFKEASNKSERLLRDYYSKLKKAINALTTADSFTTIKKGYFEFWNNPHKNTLLDMEKISEEDDAVLSRCVVALSSLIDLEEMFNDPELIPADPFVFFLSCLRETEYVKAGQKPGVNIFKWRVAAASPFACHFILNASQSAASVLYQPMKFLRQDKRKALGLEDRDASGAFFTLCGAGDGAKSRTRISASEQTFSGWAIPHSFFARSKTPVPLPCPANKTENQGSLLEDPYALERRFWREARNSGETLNTAALKKLFPLQRNAYESWKITLTKKQNNFSFFASPVSADIGGSGAEQIRDLLAATIRGEDGYLTVTPTRDLNEYYRCPLFWLYTRIFKADEFSLEATLLDDISLGLLYHKILEKLFARIKDEDKTFNSTRLDSYKRWAMEITRTVIKEEPAFKGPLAIPLVSPQAAGMAKKIAKLLDLENKKFAGYSVAELELRVSFRTGDILLKGSIDRVSVSPEGEPVIVDYKTSYLPKQTEMDKLGENPLSEFQIPVYIKLYEEKLAEKTAEAANREARKVQGAFFYSINDKKIKTVMSENSREKTGEKTALPNREEYEPILEAAEKQIQRFAEKVSALDFIPGKVDIGKCFDCVYKTACRTAYFLNRESGVKAGER